MAKREEKNYKVEQSTNPDLDLLDTQPAAANVPCGTLRLLSHTCSTWNTSSCGKVGGYNRNLLAF